MEIPIQQVWCNSAHFTLVRAVFLHSDTANQTQLLHKPLDSLVIQWQIAVTQLRCDTTVTISAFIFVVNCGDLFLGCLVLMCRILKDIQDYLVVIGSLRCGR